MNGAKAAERSLDDYAAALEDDTLRHEEPFFELLSPPSARRTVVLGIIGAAAFFAIWEAGYLAATWELFGSVYKEAGVTDVTAPASEGLDSSVLDALVADGVGKTYTSNAWIGRVGL
ncbi:MAG: hypothetical protein V3U44_00610 [Alphaproteobacteria bacterium]